MQAFIDKFLEAVDFETSVEVTETTPLADLPEWDSLAALGVIVMADMEYGKTIAGEDLKKCTTVGDLGRLIAG
ncbi:acyl carrier protein [Pseudorhodoferax soli]|uniref:Acyl carrier protein n=1 Tax=Pseudorhodoferax soli TaxID=545864 RepID=A0A368XNL6_9BURK|nr:acyl carrier protein [Pseudorhodoferax soli]RCW67604.1 acyl carrier protein [Pseudorhodoferax soli]